jgi:hypothetical protein
MVMSETIIIRCAKCHGTGKLKDGIKCPCHYFGGPVKRFSGDLWEVERRE